MKIKERTLTGTKTKKLREYETRHAQLARTAAAQGMVLLKNENHILPLQYGSQIALYGGGAVRTVKGGTGSGDVNERRTISIYEGMEEAGFQITTKQWLSTYEITYKKEREIWRKRILERAEQEGMEHLFDIYSQLTFSMPVGEMPEKTEAEIAIYVISRTAGEGKDRTNEKGDYYLSAEEEQQLNRICQLYNQVIIIINTGGVIDCSFLDCHPNIQAVLYSSQPGMEGGRAVADIISGKVVPCGKLTDTWAYSYEQYPNALNYSHLNGNLEQEVYSEGIYVGYRYFDTFEIPVRFGFGFGLSYTPFSMEVVELKNSGTEFLVSVKVTNQGDCYTAREVVQLYIAPPQMEQNKEYRRLVGFAKTAELAPLKSELITIAMTASDMASYMESKEAWVLEAGCYGIYIGNSLNDSVLVGSIDVKEFIVVSKLKHICPVKESILEEKPNQQLVQTRHANMEAACKCLKKVTLNKHEIQTEIIDYTKKDPLMDADVMEFVNRLETEQLIQLATGELMQQEACTIGSAGIHVPGSAAETSSCAKEQGLASIVLADGPAGLRLQPYYEVKDGQIIPYPFHMGIEGGFLYQNTVTETTERYYQYCTAMPVGTLLAQTWDVKLLQTVGKAIAEEMNLFHITLWLAPGMNIHRNPLCGRNFEYYSEDPVVSGITAASVTAGVQSVAGCGTTIKHFCCNNQEDNRRGTDSIVSERALREIYLKGFELAIKRSNPMSIMTSYNLINGIHAANNYDICTNVARKEWGFQGVIMTDWGTTEGESDCTAANCIKAGNDLVMPGQISDQNNIKEGLEAGTITQEQLKLCIAHLINVIVSSNQYEDRKPY